MTIDEVFAWREKNEMVDSGGYYDGYSNRLSWEVYKIKGKLYRITFRNGWLERGNEPEEVIRKERTVVTYEIPNSNS